MGPQAKGHQRLPGNHRKLGRDKEGFRWSVALSAPGFPASGLQACEEVNPCCFKPCRLRDSVMAALGNAHEEFQIIILFLLLPFLLFLLFLPLLQNHPSHPHHFRPRYRKSLTLMWGVQLPWLLFPPLASAPGALMLDINSGGFLELHSGAPSPATWCL